MDPAGVHTYAFQVKNPANVGNNYLIMIEHNVGVFIAMNQGGGGGLAPQLYPPQPMHSLKPNLFCN